MFYLIIIVISLALSFFFSGSETAFLSVNKVRVEVWRRRKDRVAEPILQFLRKPEDFLYTTLIGNNIFNVAFVSFATVYLHRFLDPEVTWLAIVVATLLIGEIIPKTVFRSLADWVIRQIAYPLKFFYWLLWPFTQFISHISELILALFGYRKSEVRRFFSERDVEILLSESPELVKRKSAEEGEFVEESDFLRNVLELKELWVREVMVPRTRIVAVPDTISIDELIRIFKKNGYTRLPVYHENMDNIVGVVYLKDLFLGYGSFHDLIRKPTFVPETKRCSELLSELRQQNTAIAIVIDEYGGTAGLITTEDLVEELFGDIEDEYDEEAVLVRKAGVKTYRVNARIEIEKLNAKLALNLPDGDYETLAGFLIDRLGIIPRRDTEFQYNGIEFLVTRATRRKVEWVRITLP